ncbi:MAG: formate dehydrogenase accessory sulfurtransferase FdhD, partial [Chitinivibrionales bacterium]|nr:formate dehydrogenase accessory sulfurtransferase FdhD [Chitinivibrionales bacterium]
YTSGCGKCAMYTTIGELFLKKKIENSTTLPRQKVFDLAEQLQKGTSIFSKTGSVHSAILIDLTTERQIARDDVARHNAVDKVVGRALVENLDFARCLLTRTGRTSAEIVYKIRKCGIPITIARGAPTHQAVHLAREMGITLIGFARERSFNIYAGAERIQ